MQLPEVGLCNATHVISHGQLAVKDDAQIVLASRQYDDSTIKLAI